MGRCGYFQCVDVGLRYCRLGWGRYITIGLGRMGLVWWGLQM